jgi:hypothetical protein
MVRTGGIREGDIFKCDFAFEGEFTVADGFFRLAGQGSEGEDLVRGFLRFGNLRN